MEQDVKLKDASDRYFTNYYTAYVKYDSELDEYYIELPSTSMFHLGWNVGDDIEFDVREDTRNVIIRKKEKKNV